MASSPTHSHVGPHLYQLAHSQYSWPHPNLLHASTPAAARGILPSLSHRLGPSSTTCPADLPVTPRDGSYPTLHCWPQPSSGVSQVARLLALPQPISAAPPSCHHGLWIVIAAPCASTSASSPMSPATIHCLQSWITHPLYLLPVGHSP